MFLEISAAGGKFTGTIGETTGGLRRAGPARNVCFRLNRIQEEGVRSAYGNKRRGPGPPAGGPSSSPSVTSAA